MARNVQGTWQAFQSNGYTATFNVFQHDNGVLTGTAESGNASSDNCTGKVTDADFLLTVPWSPDSVGEYSGTFNLQGRIVGVTVDLKHSQNVAGWSSSAVFPA